MKKHFNELISVMLVMVLTVMLVSVNDIEVVAEKSSLNTLQNPTRNSNGNNVWDCVWFGNYPQAEVIPSGEYTSLDSSQLQEGDTIVSDAIYNKLQSTVEWDDNGDIIIDGNKYRRIQKSDATYVCPYEWNNYYNWENSPTYHYFKYEPIKWRVLNVNGDDVFLVADKGLDDQMYNISHTSVTWEASTIRSWLNGYEAYSNTYGTDYTSKNFIDTAFSSSEQSAIKTSKVIDDGNMYYGIEGGNNTNDKVFLLSESEVCRGSAIYYGFVSGYSDEARKGKCSTYAKAMGTWSYEGDCVWWLRSPGDDTDEALRVSLGSVDRRGYIVNAEDYAIRPALHLDLSFSNLYSYAGTVCSDGSENVEGGIEIIEKPTEEMTEGEQSTETEVEITHTLKNPTKNNNGNTVWDCVWFGSYPQAEVVPSGEYTALNKSLIQKGDIIASDTIYGKLQKATGWNVNGDINIDGNKYKRIKKSDATETYDEPGINRYNWFDSNTYHYFKYQPIKWRVLNVDGNVAFLLADKGLDGQKYNILYTSVTWETSTIRSWLNGYGATYNKCGTDYSSKNFISTAFSTLEQLAIKDTTVIDYNSKNMETKVGDNTNDKIFLLSEPEVYTNTATSYGFDPYSSTDDKARVSNCSTYAKAMGVSPSYYLGGNYSDSDYWGKYNWWLRSPGDNTADASEVGPYGRAHRYSSRVDYNNAVRPALHLNLSSSNFYSYAGMVCSDGTVNEEGGEVIIEIPTEEAIKPQDNKSTIESSETTKSSAVYPESTAKENVSAKKVSGFKVKNTKGKKAKLTWKKLNNVSGYQIMYATNKKFSKGKKTVNIKKAKTTSKLIKNLKKKKTYYFKIRAYKNVSGKKNYGTWSKVQSVKIKK